MATFCPNAVTSDGVNLLSLLVPVIMLRASGMHVLEKKAGRELETKKRRSWGSYESIPSIILAHQYSRKLSFLGIHPSRPVAVLGTLVYLTAKWAVYF